MLVPVKEARDIVRLVSSKVEGSTFWLVYEKAAGEKYAIQLSVEALAATQAATLIGLAHLQASLPRGQVPQPTLQASKPELVVSSEGWTGMKVTVPGGAELVLQFPAEELATLRHISEEALAYLSPLKN